MINPNAPSFLQTNPRKQEDELDMTTTRVNPNAPSFLNQRIQTDIEQPTLRDQEVRNYLGIDLDKEWENNQEEVKSYIDSLSSEDYKIWSNLKNEGYSLSARKALFDNREDLWDITNPGFNKYIESNTDKINSLADIAQAGNDLYEQTIHPWTQELKGKLDERTNQLLEENTWENRFDQIIGDQFNSSFMPSKGEIALATVGATARKALGSIDTMLTQAAKLGPDIIDFITNMGTQLGGEGVNLLNQAGSKLFGYDYDPVTVDPSQRSTIRGSWISLRKDTGMAAFMVAYPIATFVMESIAAANPNIEEWMQTAYGSYEDLLKKILIEGNIGSLFSAGLNDQEREELVQAVAQETTLLAGVLLEGLGKKVSKSDMARNLETATKYSREFSKQYSSQQVGKRVGSYRSALEGTEPGTELINKKGKTIATKTEGGIKIQPHGYIELLKTKGGSAWKSFWKSFEWFYKNKDKWLVTRDPNMPVGELPVVGVPKEENKVSTPVEEEKVTDEIKTEPKNEVTPVPGKKVKTQTIGEFIKKVSNDLSGKKGGLDNELMERLKTSPELQNEYVNTIDPYIKANGVENPEGVIQGQLTDFVNTVKKQIQERINNNTEFKKWHIKHGTQIPEYEKVQWNEADKKLRNLIKILSSKNENPEKFLQYLLNLPEETVNEFNKLIPDFSQNLSLIKDTLDITKGITSSDLLGKFLKFKSTWGTRNKNYLRKLIYKYLSNKYNNQALQWNQKEIDYLINNLKEEDLIKMEDEINNGNIREMESDIEQEILKEKGYIPETMKKSETPWSFDEIADKKWLTTGKTMREYMEEKGVQISLGEDQGDLNFLLGKPETSKSVLAAYEPISDRILMKRSGNIYQYVLHHEYLHRVFNQLTTKQQLDFLAYIAKRDNISATAAFERFVELGRNFFQYRNLKGKEYLIKHLGEEGYDKIGSIMEKTKDELRDLFEIEKDKDLYQLFTDISYDTPKAKKITQQRPEDISKRFAGDKALRGNEEGRYAWMKENWDSHITEVTEGPFNSVLVKFDNKPSMTWEEFKKTLTPEQLNAAEEYSIDVIGEFIDEKIGRGRGVKGEGKFDWNTLQNELNISDLSWDAKMKKMEEVLGDSLRSLEIPENKLDSYKKIIKDIDPDIIGLTEKNGKIHVKYLIDSNVERWELPNRPGYVEIKEVPAIDYFTEEEMNQLPKDLVDLIKKDAD